MSFWCLQFFQKTNKNNSTWGTIVVRSNFFLCFFLKNWRYQKDILKLTDLSKQDFIKKVQDSKTWLFKICTFLFLPFFICLFLFILHFPFLYVFSLFFFLFSFPVFIFPFFPLCFDLFCIDNNKGHTCKNFIPMVVTRAMANSSKKHALLMCRIWKMGWNLFSSLDIRENPLFVLFPA